jgi:ABC-type multidrug transport system ATPase subunit
VEGISKRFGKAIALQALSFTVPEGSICAFIGPNGAGKTTTMSILSGFLRPDQGSVNLLDKGAFDPQIHQGLVGVLPQDAELPLASTPRQVLTAWAGLQGLSRSAAAEAADQAIQLVLLRDRADKAIRTLSHGMRRRVTVASALLGDPKLVLLDEPTSGLDPSQAAHLRGVIAELRGKKTVLISSHNLLELERLCDYVVLINQGRCFREGLMNEVTRRNRECWIQLASPVPAGRNQKIHLKLQASDSRSLEEAVTAELAQLIQEGALIQEVSQGESLEQRYLSDTDAA